jgi:secreted PhoX family phosphatase
VARPARIAGYGRFNHEAAAVDPVTNVAYFSEDRSDSCIYRFLPRDKHKPFEGKLQALEVKGSDRLDVARALAPKQRVAVDWVDVADPDPSGDTVRKQAQERGAALIRRGEGMWLFGDSVYVVSTSGGRASSGQVLELRIGRSGASDTLENVAEGNGESGLEAPDNVTVAPTGELYLCEDGGGDQYLRGISKRGKVFDLARNAGSGGELAGACFSPDGRALFVNLQREGLTLAILGPFAELAKSHA